MGFNSAFEGVTSLCEEEKRSILRIVSWANWSHGSSSVRLCLHLNGGKPHNFLISHFSLHLRQLRQWFHALRGCIFAGPGANFMRRLGANTVTKKKKD